MKISCLVCKGGFVKTNSNQKYCVSCTENGRRRKAKQWRDANLEKHRNTMRLWRRDNPDKVREIDRRSYRNNLEKKREAHHRWYIANLEKCKKKDKENVLRQRRNNPEKYREKMNERARRWYRENPDKAKAGISRRQVANPDIYKRIRERWNDANPEKRAAIKHARRGALGSFTSSELKEKFRLRGNKCAHCKSEKKKLTIDHIVPLKLGGSNYIDNIQFLCKSCNSSKGARFIG